MQNDRSSTSVQSFHYPQSGLTVESHWSGIASSEDPVNADVSDTHEPDPEQLKRASESGRRVGVEEGRRIELLEGAARLEQSEKQKIEQLAKMNERFALEQQSFLNAIEPEIVALALRIAERILRHEAQVDPLILTGAVRVALSQLADKTTVRIHIPAVDADLWKETIEHMPNLRVKPVTVADEHLGTGECQLETAAGVVDLGVQSQLHEVGLNLLGQKRDERKKGDAGS